MFKKLEKRPKPFKFYTASDLWTDAHTSKQMLLFHLNEKIDVASRNKAFINESVKWIISYFNVGNKTKIIDFGCGPGLYTTELAKKKADVTGIDFSKRSIRYARKVSRQKKLLIKYISKNYLRYNTNSRFNLILMIMCDFCALSPSQRNLILTKFYKFLEPGGHVLLDVYSLNAFEEREEQSTYEANLLNGFWSKNKYYGFLNTFKYMKEKVVLDKYTIIEKNSTRKFYNWLQYYSTNSLKKEFGKHGFVTENIYSDVAGASFKSKGLEFAVVAKKRL